MRAKPPKIRGQVLRPDDQRLVSKTIGKTLLARRVYDERARLGITQRELAQRIEGDVAMLSRIESGKTPTPAWDTMIKLADEYEVSLDYLAGRSDIRDYTPRKKSAA